ncbi:hypothetical protein TRFO_12806 [Tritrichomonas foetus]|uniref:Importin N-terminal domain-containing protein n=1 Tax=Tritrichomonas foetus TaxID=1144522 RepID=A0A1J4L098_9EUKA|nr:hypothetical protein TRFO_12806 [Tritrichomonas foetus]|eukprot:OHT16927.1 hypothetical protein TRFO_12806 [Tritrichomonas foetus]
MDAFIHALTTCDPQTPEGHQSEINLVKLRDENPVLFIQFLTQVFLSANSINGKALSLAIVISRTVLPRKIPIHGNPISNFPLADIDNLLNSLFALFSHPSDEIRLHASVTFGHFAMFRLHDDQNANNYLNTLIQPFSTANAQNPNEPLISSCATALDRILRELKLSDNQKVLIFNSTFSHICSDYCSNMTRVIVIPFLSEFMNDIPFLIGSNLPLFAQNIEKLAANGFVADTVFLFLSDVVKLSYEMLQFMPNIIEISSFYLSNSNLIKNQTNNQLIPPTCHENNQFLMNMMNFDRNNENLVLNILRFWICVSSNESDNSSCFHLASKAMPSHFPLFFNIFVTSFETVNNNSDFCVKIEDWNLYSASYVAIARFVQSDLNHALNILQPILSTEGTPPIITLHIIYTLLIADYREITGLALQMAHNSLGSGSNRLINHGLLIINELVLQSFHTNQTINNDNQINASVSREGTTDLPLNDFLNIGLRQLVSKDSVVCSNAAMLIMTLIDKMESITPKSSVSAVMQPLLQIISSSQEPFVISTTINLITPVVKTLDLSDSMTLFPTVLQIAQIAISQSYDEEIISSLLTLLANILNSIKNIFYNPDQNQEAILHFNNNFAGEIFKFAASVIEMNSCLPAAFRLLSVFCIVHQGFFNENFLQSTLNFVDATLKESQNYQDINAALTYLGILVPRCGNKIEIVLQFIPQCFYLLTLPEISHFVAPKIFEALSAIFFHCPNSILSFTDNIADFIDEASDLMLQPIDDDDVSLSYASSVAEITALNLINGNREKMIPIALKVINEISKIDQFTTSLLIGFVDIVRVLSDMLPTEKIAQIVHSPAINNVLKIAHENGDPQMKQDVQKIIQKASQQS